MNEKYPLNISKLVTGKDYFSIEIISNETNSACYVTIPNSKNLNLSFQNIGIFIFLKN